MKIANHTCEKAQEALVQALCLSNLSWYPFGIGKGVTA
jgi:hypothetical protein